jgi:hypothetical protein
MQFEACQVIPAESGAPSANISALIGVPMLQRKPAGIRSSGLLLVPENRKGMVELER